MLLGGCSLVSFVRRSPPPMPEPVRPGPAIVEMEAALLQWAEDAAALVESRGAEPGAPLVAQMREAIRAGSLRAGKPTDPLPRPETTAGRLPAVDSAIRSLQAENKALRKAEAEWWAEYERLRGTPVKTGWRVGSGALGWAFWVMVGLAALGAIGVPVIPWLSSALAGARRVTRQIVEAIEDFKADGAPQEVSRLKAHLAESMDRDAKLAVDRIRRA